MISRVGASQTWIDAISQWLIVLRAAGRPETTIALRNYQLRRTMVSLSGGPWDVTGAELVDFLGSQGWGRETLRSWRSALRGFYGWAHEQGLVDVDPSRALPKVDPKPPMPRPTPEAVYRAALVRADERTRLMIRLAAELGLRRGEVARLRADDLERDALGWSLRVHGKGDRPRVVPVPPGFALSVHAHRQIGYLFPGKVNGHLSPAWVGKIVSRAMPGAWTMHTLRHRFGTVAFSIDRDLLAVQELLGHASPATTRRYVQVPPDNLRRTVAAVAAV